MSTPVPSSPVLAVPAGPSLRHRFAEYLGMLGVLALLVLLFGLGFTAQGLALVFENMHLVMAPGGASLERSFLIDSLLSWSTSPALFHSPHCLVLMAEYLGELTGALQAAVQRLHRVAHPDGPSVDDPWRPER